MRDRLVDELVARYADWTSIVGLSPTEAFTLSLDWLAAEIDLQPPAAG